MLEKNKLFIKYYKCPISVTKNNLIFNYLLNLLNPYYNTLDKYLKFEKELLLFNGNIELMRKKHSNCMTNLLEKIKNGENYNLFCSLTDQELILINEEKLNQLNLGCLNNINIQEKLSKKDVYNQENIDLEFISIDLCKANFQSILYINNDFFDGEKDYDLFMKKNGLSEVMIDSKIFRQRLFGFLCPQKQQYIQKLMISNILKLLLKNGLNPNSIKTVNTDEIILLNDNSLGINLNEIDKILNILKYNLRIEYYQLQLISDKNKTSFLKKFNCNKNDKIIDFKNVNKQILAQAIKKYENKNIEENDLFFENEDGLLCKFVDLSF